MIAIGADIPSQRDVSSRLKPPASSLSQTGGSVVFVQMDQQTIADYPVGGAATTPTFRYIYASYIDEPVVRKGPTSTSTVHFYHRNHQYSVTAITNSAGAISERYAYTAYGQPTILNASGTPLSPQTSTLNSRYSYTGREWDATLGLHHFRARWMSPSAGRFLGRDPIGYGAGRNFYAYVNGLPFVFTDPSGMFQANVQANAFIPYKWLMVDPQSWVKGDNREISGTPLGLAKSRALQRATVEMEECVQKDPEIDKFSDISPSHMYTISYLGGYDKYLEETGSMTASITITRTGKCDVRVDMVMHGKLPFIFVPLAPAIDWHFSYDLHFLEVGGIGILHGTFNGTHDGFPAYESYVKNSLIYSHDPRKTGETPLSLFPPEEHSASAGFFFLGGKASCCDCKFP